MRTSRFHGNPCNHAIVDDFVTKAELDAVNKEWPAHDWEGWIQYNPKYEAKRASNLITPLPPAASMLLAKMGGFELGQLVEMPNAVPDLSLHAGGLHECLPGGKLDPHLDA